MLCQEFHFGQNIELFEKIDLIENLFIYSFFFFFKFTFSTVYCIGMRDDSIL